MKTVANIPAILQRLSNYWQANLSAKKNAAIRHFDGGCNKIEFFENKKTFLNIYCHFLSIIIG